MSRLASVLLFVALAAITAQSVFVEDADVTPGFTGVASKPYCEKYLGSAAATCRVAVFGGGGFLKLRDAFSTKNGVLAAKIGFTGGFKKANFTYLDVCMGRTGHSEAVMVLYNSSVVRYAELLELFFQSHDATIGARISGHMTRSRRSVGRQFRSVVFTRNKDQLKAASDYIEKLNAAASSNASKEDKKDGSPVRIRSRTIVTDVVTFGGTFIVEGSSDATLLQIREQAEAQVKQDIEKLQQQFAERRKKMEDKVKASAAVDNQDTAPITLPPRTTVEAAARMKEIEEQLAQRPTRLPIETLAPGTPSRVENMQFDAVPKARDRVNGNARGSPGTDYLSEMRRYRLRQDVRRRGIADNNVPAANRNNNNN